MHFLEFLQINSKSTWKAEIASDRKQESISTLDKVSLLIWARPTTLRRRKRPSEISQRRSLKKLSRDSQ
jgi:hypothetical protein